MNREILEAALEGLESQKQKLENHIAAVYSLMGRKPARDMANDTASSTPAKRVLSPEARKRIAAAQKKRWAAYHKNQPKVR